MKTMTARKPANHCTYRPAAAIPYPNAARKGYFLDRVLDGLLAGVITLAVLTGMLFLFTAL